MKHQLINLKKKKFKFKKSQKKLKLKKFAILMAVVISSTVQATNDY